MGVVFKAFHARLNRMVAIKMLAEGRHEDAAANFRFDREMRAVGSLDHPSIVRALDAREIDGRRILVMEFVEGMDLAELVRRCGLLPIADACELIRQAATGVASCSRAGIGASGHQTVESHAHAAGTSQAAGPGAGPLPGPTADGNGDDGLGAGGGHCGIHGPRTGLG